MPTDIVDFHIFQYSTKKVEIYVGKDPRERAVVLEFHPNLWYAWHTENKQDRKTIKMALSRFLGYEPDVAV